MAELRRRSSTFGVNGIGEPPKPGEGIGPHPELAVFGAPFRCDGAIRDGGHPDSAGGWATMELDQLVGDQGVGSFAFECRGLDDSISKGHRAELRRGEHVGSSGHRVCLSRELFAGR